MRQIHVYRLDPAGIVKVNYEEDVTCADEHGIRSFVARHLRKSNQLNYKAYQVTYDADQRQDEVDPELFLNSGINLFDLCNNSCLHPQLVLGESHLQLRLLIGPWLHIVDYFVGLGHSFVDLKAEEAAEDVRKIEEEEPHLAGRSNEEKEEYAE